MVSRNLVTQAYWLDKSRLGAVFIFCQEAVYMIEEKRFPLILVSRKLVTQAYWLGISKLGLCLSSVKRMYI